jgi:hypothetical protein
MPIKQKNGPTVTEVLVFGLFAFLLSNRTRAEFLCEHCKTVFDNSSTRFSRVKFSAVFLVLAIVLAATVIVALLAFQHQGTSKNHEFHRRT